MSESKQKREPATEAPGDRSRRLGPRGGQTTVTPGGLNRLSTYLLPEEREAVRRRAFEDDHSISEVIRTAIRRYLDLP
jgi:hypothetical protein